MNGTELSSADCKFITELMDKLSTGELMLSDVNKELDGKSLLVKEAVLTFINKMIGEDI